MKEDEKSRLVFSTETHVEGCEQIEGYDGGLGSEVRQERNETIDLMNKSIRRGIKEKGFVMREKVLQTRKDVTTLVGYLWRGNMTYKQLYESLYRTNIEEKTKIARLNNITQILRVGSGGIIYSKDGYWQLSQEARPSSMTALVNQIMDNRKHLWEKKSSKGERKDVSNRETEAGRLIKAPKKSLTIPKKIEKKLVIDSPVGEITINLNIKITVEGI